MKIHIFIPKLISNSLPNTFLHLNSDIIIVFDDGEEYMAFRDALQNSSQVPIEFKTSGPSEIKSLELKIASKMPTEYENDVLDAHAKKKKLQAEKYLDECISRGGNLPRIGLEIDKTDIMIVNQPNNIIITPRTMQEKEDLYNHLFTNVLPDWETSYNDQHHGEIIEDPCGWWSSYLGSL